VSRGAPTDAGTVDKYKQAFQEEAREILVELEATLLELNENRDNADLVGQAFRALHTIKGSGAMFGFTAVAAFTHDVENAFDEVRNGRLNAGEELINLSLAALDHIEAMLDEAVGRGVADTLGAATILKQLRALTGSKGDVAVEPHERRSAHIPAAANGAAVGWKICFAPGPELMCNGTDPLLLLKELKQLGELSVTAKMDAIPAMKELDPQCCYIRWEMVLTTLAGVEAIRDVFIFAEDACELSIEPQSALLSGEAAEEDRRRIKPRAEEQAGTSSNIRVPTTKLDQFVDLVGELVTVQARLAEIASRLDDPDVGAVSEEVERLTSALRENSMSIRMLPIRATFERFRRLIHDLARDLGKEVELTIEGADTELDKTVIDQLNDPLMHLIRNSMDHGIELPKDRLAAGKRATAKIHLSARYAGACVLISVSDDGHGIDVAAVRHRGVERGLISADAQLEQSEIFKLIFEPGFSTVKQITDLSGRGVGMDVVRRGVDALRGSIDIASKAGAGTDVSLRLPLTLAIIDGLLVNVGDAYFVLPVASILECIELTRQDRVNANGKHVVNVRGEIIPYIRLKDFFHMRPEERECEQIMVVATDSGRFGFVVDRVIGDHQTVIKNLGKFYRQVQVISGATILGNGVVALVLDPSRLVQEVIRIGSSNAGVERSQSNTWQTEERGTQREILQ
jgi:two-component system, chemotaxis family, sensor kinase CheA